VITSRDCGRMALTDQPVDSGMRFWRGTAGSTSGKRRGSRSFPVLRSRSPCWGSTFSGMASATRLTPGSRCSRADPSSTKGGEPVAYRGTSTCRRSLPIPRRPVPLAGRMPQPASHSGPGPAGGRPAQGCLAPRRKRSGATRSSATQGRWPSRESAGPPPSCGGRSCRSR
jgi:hypothetical protein